MIPQGIGVPGAFVISDEEALTRIRRHTAHVLGRGAYRRIEVALPVAQRERFEREINARYRACGCLESGFSVLLTIVALIIWNVVYSEQPGYPWGEVALDFGVVLSAGVLGKVLGIARAHSALKGTLRELASALAARDNKGGLDERLP